MSQSPYLKSLLCRSKFESQQKNHEIRNCGKNCHSCPFLLKASSYPLKLVNKKFLIKKLFSNLKAVICFMLSFANDPKKHI